MILLSVARATAVPEPVLALERFHVCPAYIQFHRYSKDQLRSILSPRVGAAVHQSALALCAEKVASASGDARYALLVCADAVQSALSDCRRGSGVATVEHMHKALHDMAETLLKVRKSLRVHSYVKFNNLQC
jgi:Cdc6-like AAA superfamily ATPase